MCPTYVRLLMSHNTVQAGAELLFAVNYNHQYTEEQE